MIPLLMLGSAAFCALGWCLGRETAAEKKRTQKIREAIEAKRQKYQQDLKNIENEFQQKQAELEAEIARKEKEYELNFYDRKVSLEDYAKTERLRIHKEYEAKLAQLKEDHLKAYEKQRWEERKEECTIYIQEAEEHLQDVVNIYDLLKGRLDSQRKTINSGSTTAYQRHALCVLNRDSMDTKERFNAYKNYLKGYIRHMKSVRRNRSNNDELSPFSTTIPENCLYKGKLVYWTLEEIKESGFLPIEQVDEGAEFIVDDLDSYSMTEHPGKLPLLCSSVDMIPMTGFNGRQYFHPVYHLSLAKGELRLKLDSCQRVYEDARVISYGAKNIITLVNKDGVNLSLPVQNLQDPYNKPFRNAELTVVVADWNNDLADGKITVSEKVEDTFNSLAFDGIPVLFSEEKWYREFYPAVEALDLFNARNEWKIALADEETLQVKFQYGEDMVFLAHVENIDGTCAFIYDRLLGSSNEKIKAEDAFIVVESSLDAALVEEYQEIPEADRQAMSAFAHIAFDEFTHQQINRAARNGLPYFNKWLDITNKHVDNLLCQAGKVELTLDIDEKLENKKYRELHIGIQEAEKLEQFYTDVCESLQSDLTRPRFFIETAPGVRHSVVIKDSDMRQITISYPDKSVIEYLNSTYKITVYAWGNCYPEQQQRRALINFQQGNVANPALKTFALEPTSIYASSTPVEAIEFFDKNIAGDQSQADTVRKALEEDNLFLIQGPPGTGKTTVITELILQTLKKNTNASILVTSQSNVAVDNVLKKILSSTYGKIYNIVRCGEKLDPELENYSIDKLYKDYVIRMLAKANAYAEDEVIQSHVARLKQEGSERAKGSYCENILAGADIVGATCVGLANRHIGLDKLNFDLVIIDEAGKALPAELLIPYNRGKKVVLLGDHKQLPPVISPKIAENELIRKQYGEEILAELWEESLFERIFSGAPLSIKSMLETQYRMPAGIGSIISESFYEDKLGNGTNTLSKEPLLFDKNIVFFDHGFPETSGNDKGVSNPEESMFIGEMVKAMWPKLTDSEARIAVITPYKEQKRQITKALKKALGDRYNKRIKVDTVDSFQGEEAELVIYSTTRTRRITNFFKDFRRVNVALSRTKRQLCIVGSLKYFDRYDEASGDCLPVIAKHVRNKEQALIYHVPYNPLRWSTQLHKWVG